MFFVPQWSQLFVVTLLMLKYFNHWLDTDASPTTANTNATAANETAATSTAMSNALYYNNINGNMGLVAVSYFNQNIPIFFPIDLQWRDDIFWKPIWIRCYVYLLHTWDGSLHFYRFRSQTPINSIGIFLRCYEFYMVNILDNSNQKS